MDHRGTPRLAWLSQRNVIVVAIAAVLILAGCKSSGLFASQPLDIPPGGLPWLHVEGNRVVDESGDTFIMRGVNIENREWIWSYQQTIDYERSAIPKVTRAPDDEDGWGANVILLAVASGPINRGETAYLDALDEMVALAKENGAYTLIVWRYDEPDTDQPNMPNEDAEDALASLALRYADEPAVLYGLQVEPHDASWATLKPLFTSMIDAIRANNPNSLIAVPGTQWGRYVHGMLTDPIERDNLILKSHPYDTWTAINIEYFYSQVTAQYPVILGEFGAGDFSSLDDVRQLLDFAEANGMGWIAWMFNAVGCPCLLSDVDTFATTNYGAEVKWRLQVAAGADISEPEPVPTPSSPQNGPTRIPPADLTPEEVPLFVTFGFDDNYRPEGNAWIADTLFAGRTNPAGTGNPATFDGLPARAGLFFIGFQMKDYGVDFRDSVQHLYDMGHEIGNHSYENNGGLSRDGWLQAIADTNAQLVSLGIPATEIYGFRAPEDAYNTELYEVLEQLGFTYDASITSGWQPGDEGTNLSWPYSLENGSPDADWIHDTGFHSYTPPGDHPTLWEVPESVFYVPTALQSTYGTTAGYCDWNWINDDNAPPEDWVEFFKETLQQRLEGNRAPLHICLHGQYYGNEHWFEDDARAGTAERQQALLEMLDYALSLPDVRVVSPIDVLNWMNDPVPLGKAPAAAPNPDPTLTPTASPTLTPVPAPSLTPTQEPDASTSLSLQPQSATIAPGDRRQFTATVTGTEDHTVTWEIVNQSVSGGSVGDSFYEPFLWAGDHAATIPGGQGTTVWWDQDAWETRGDSSFNAVDSEGIGNYIDIQRGVSDPASGVIDSRNIVGGNGDQGVAIMHLDFEGIMDARLRNPLLLSASQPGVVEFSTSNFVTTGHWWEIALSPTDQVLGGEFTAVPSPDSSFDDLQGSGHSPAEDSINFLAIGRTDVPATSGWDFKIGVRRSLNGTITQAVGPSFPTSPSEKDKLYRWRLEFYPDRVEAYADLNEDGVLERLRVLNIAIPWSEVHVHLLGVGYQADHHPQDAGFQGQVRDLPWKDVTIGPVKYARTAAYPKSAGNSRTLQQSGWLGYDLRDHLRTGSVGGVQQPNDGPYNRHESMAFCSDGGVYGCEVGLDSKTLSFTLPGQDAADMVNALFLYDIRGPGSAQLTVNGTLVGDLPRPSTVEARASEHWIHRSIAVNPVLLHAGNNTVTIAMTGNVQMDRLQFEFAYGQPGVSLPSLGTLTPSGLFIAAPGSAEGAVVIRATSDADPSIYDQATLTVAVAQPTPTPTATPRPTSTPIPTATPTPALQPTQTLPDGPDGPSKLTPSPTPTATPTSTPRPQQPRPPSPTPRPTQTTPDRPGQQPNATPTPIPTPTPAETRPDPNQPTLTPTPTPTPRRGPNVTPPTPPAGRPPTPTPTPRPTPEPSDREIPKTSVVPDITVSANASGRDDQGNSYQSTPGAVTVVEEAGRLVVALPVSVPQGRALESFTDPVSGVSVEVDQQGAIVVELPIRNEEGETQLTIRAAVDSLAGADTAATGVVQRLELETALVAADLSSTDPRIGIVDAQFTADLNSLPEDASVQLGLAEQIDPEVVVRYTAVSEDADLEIVDIAYTLEVTTENLRDAVEGATVRFSVGRAWVEQFGTGSVLAIRQGDDGRTELLVTRFVAFEGDIARFEADSPNGLSLFSLMSVRRKSEPTPAPTLTAAQTTATPVSQTETPTADTPNDSTASSVALFIAIVVSIAAIGGALFWLVRQAARSDG